MLTVIRSLLFQALFISSTLIYAPLCLPLFALPLRWRYPFITSWSRFNLWALAQVCGLRFHVEGRENIPTQPAIICCKHQSAWETLALQLIFPPQTWVLKRELLWVPFFGWGLAALQPIAIDRQAGRKAVRQLIAQGSERLQHGRWVVVFPEGTRVSPGETGRYGIGGALLSAESGRPVVPVAHNAGLFWPRRAWLKKPGTVTVSIGPVLQAAPGEDAKAFMRRCQDWIEPETRRLEQLIR